MTIAIFHKDEEVYIQMTPERFEVLLTKYLETMSPKDAIKAIINDLKKQALRS